MAKTWRFTALLNCYWINHLSLMHVIMVVFIELASLLSSSSHSHIPLMWLSRGSTELTVMVSYPLSRSVRSLKGSRRRAIVSMTSRSCQVNIKCLCDLNSSGKHQKFKVQCNGNKWWSPVNIKLKSKPNAMHAVMQQHEWKVKNSDQNHSTSRE